MHGWLLGGGLVAGTLTAGSLACGLLASLTGACPTRPRDLAAVRRRTRASFGVGCRGRWVNPFASAPDTRYPLQLTSVGPTRRRARGGVGEQRFR
jgi:hypothetical protein